MCTFGIRKSAGIEQVTVNDSQTTTMSSVCEDKHYSNSDFPIGNNLRTVDIWYQGLCQPPGSLLFDQWQTGRMCTVKSDAHQRCTRLSTGLALSDSSVSSWSLPLLSSPSASGHKHKLGDSKFTRECEPGRLTNLYKSRTALLESANLTCFL